jgi:hypothetical protein
MAGIPIDGNSGVLAYNNFPEDGDMVIDTADNFYNDTSGSSLRLRNILAHEHGHGMGQLHVCPTSQTKLLEPFISVAYDGPQQDDILNAQRHYGDRLEDNDTAGTASSLGALGNGVNNLADDVSCDDNSDVDYYSFSVAGAKEIAVTMTPIGTTYNEGPQTNPCGTGSPFNALIVNNLDVDILDTNGSTVLASGNTQPAGSAETALAVVGGAGTYYARVNPGSTNNVQRYQLSINITDPAFIPVQIVVTSVIPSLVPTGTAITVNATITEGDETITGGSRLLNYRFDGGAFLTTPMTLVSGNDYTATLPAVACGDLAEYYVSAVGSLSGTVTAPLNGAAGPYVTDVGVVTAIFSDNFQSDKGWTASDDGVSSGFWQRGVPVNDPGWDYDPASDSDGSGSCYLTQNQNGNTDVDGGTVFLESPTIDMSAAGDYTISYDYFLNLTNDSTDLMRVEIRDNIGGGGYVTIATHTSNQGLSWTSTSVGQAALDSAGVTLSSSMQLRYSTNDADPQSINESGLDAFAVTALICEPGCTDTDGDGVCDPNDICPGFDDTVDTDGDGVPDGCDACPVDNPDDSDGDGVCDSADICPGFDDNVDTDGDGVPDGCDACPDDNPDDSDGDGVCDSADICPGFDDNIDTDGDGVPDGCDCSGDTDGDGDTDISDLGLLLANFGAAVAPGTNGDLDFNALVNIADLGLLLADFGCTP